MTLAYVYKWTHLPTLKWYVGSRTSKGCHPDDGYICSSTIKKNIIKKPNEWKRDIIDIGSPDAMYELETEILQLVDAKNDDRSFNGHNNNYQRPGILKSEKSKMKVSMSLKGHVVSDITKTKLSKAHKGKKLSFEHIEKIKKGLAGHIVSDETKQKIGDANRGKKHSEEFKKNISIRRSNSTQSPESNEKRRQKLLGRVFSEETKLKMSLAALARKNRKIVTV